MLHIPTVRRFVRLAVSLSFILFLLPVYGQMFKTINNGDWSNPTTWMGGVSPGSTIGVNDTVLIEHYVWYDEPNDLTIFGFLNIYLDTLASDPCLGRSITIETSGTLKLTHGALLFGMDCGGLPGIGQVTNKGKIHSNDCYIQIPGDWNSNGGTRLITGGCVDLGGSFINDKSLDTMVNFCLRLGLNGTGNFENIDPALSKIHLWNNTKILFRGSAGNFMNNGTITGGAGAAITHLDVETGSIINAGTWTSPSVTSWCCGGTVCQGPLLNPENCGMDAEVCGCAADNCVLRITCPSETGGMFQCIDEIPLPDTNLVVRNDSCFDIVFEVVQDTLGLGCPMDTLKVIRYYIAIDSDGDPSTTDMRDTCIQVFHVVDTTRPIIICPAAITVNCDGNMSPAQTGTATATDNCHLAVTQFNHTDVKTPGTCSGVYSIRRDWTATDSCGNANSCSQMIFVQDTARPTIQCPSAITVNCDGNMNPAQTGTATATDNCHLAVTQFNHTDVKTRGACSGVYTLRRDWTATDSCGNANSCSQMIFVQDTMRPSVTCPSAKLINCDASQDPTALGYPIAVDQCHLAVTDLDFDDDTVDGSCIGQYDILRHWMVADSCGNVNYCTQMISVQDTTRPFIQCKEATVYLNSNGEATLNQDNVVQSTGDNCGFSHFEVSRIDFNCSDSDEAMVEVIAYDLCGNSNSCNARVYVIDTIAPKFNCPDDWSVLAEAGQCKAKVIFEISASDNCDIPAITQIDPSGLTSGDFFPEGLTTLSYDALDSKGNRSVCTFNVTVLPNLPDVPQMVCRGKLNLSLDARCDLTITPSMLFLGGDASCYDLFEVVVCDPYSKLPLNPFIPRDHLGKSLSVKLVDTLHKNSCWSTVILEDKLGPMIQCSSASISCLQLHQHDFTPVHADNCGKSSIKLLDEWIEEYTCNPDYIKAIHRKWIAEDEIGNLSDTCLQTIYISRTNLQMITYPEDYTLLCDQDFLLDQNGMPSPYQTGRPHLFGDTLWPINQHYCNFQVSYEDLDLGEINCVRKIMRTWTVREWWCHQEFVYTSLQIIVIKDETGPVITHMPYGFDATTGKRDCKARVLLPSIEAMDVCHNKLRVDVAYPGGILINQNGGYADLPVGEDTVYYRVYDGCYNVTEVYIVVHVRDETEPVAVCDRNTVVAITHNGYSWVPAEVFDDGSFDECALHHFEVRRMDVDFCGGRGEDDWGAEVGFCCEDVGKMVMVGFKAIDHSGNEAICMVNVEVQDKDRPLISCPPDITVDCRFDIDREHLEVFGKVVTEQSAREKIVIDTNYWHVIGGHPLDGLAEDNCPPTVVEDPDYGGVNQCGLGTIYRYFTAVDQQGNRSQTCLQRISITNHHVFDGSDIDWPEDYQTSNVCDPGQLIPERLVAPYDRPVVSDDECSLIGMSYHDHVLSPTIPGDPCFKIIRVWKVIDWCQRDLDNNVLIWQDTQYIKVTNLKDPEILRVTKDTVICSYDINCRPIPVSFSIEAKDDCTDPQQMLYSYKIDYNNDGTIDVVRSSIGGNVASGTWPLGKHLVKWEVEDRCGNTAKASFIMDLRNCKPPVAYCLSGLSTNLVPMDLDGDGLPDAAMDTVWASDFDAGSYHNCGYRIRLSLSSDPTDTYRIFDCDDQGMQEIELWVTDENGNQSHCKTFIDIQDNSGFCPPNIQNAKVEGEVMTEVLDRVENVGVEVRNSGRNEVMTNVEGKYVFEQLEGGNSYEVKPRKTDGWLNGVTTADIVKIQRHILGLEPLSSGYRMIAADVNRSGEITAKDVSELRRLILGITTEISGNTSWRFVNGIHTFNDLGNVLKEKIPESYEISNLNGDLKLDFYAVKVGDVTGNAATKGFGNVTSRGNSVLELQMNEQKVERGEVAEIVLKVKNGKQYEGLQFTLEWLPSLLEVITVQGNQSQRIGEENYSLNQMSQGKLSFSWNGKMEDQMELLNIQVKAKETFQVSNAFRVGNSITPSIGIGKNEEDAKIVLQFNSIGNDQVIVLANEPNPWTHYTEVGIMVPQEGDLKFTIYDIHGKVHLVENTVVKKGYHEIILRREKFTHAGVYFYQLDFGSFSYTGKMVISE